MTVGELIEELQKHPVHYRVFVEHPNDWNPETIGPECRVDWASVVDVRVDDSCTIILDATQGVV